jgi:HlyD family secretion protein
MRTIIVLLVTVCLVVACGFYYVYYVSVETPSNFRVATVKRDDLLPTIPAPGTLEPEEVVDVGAQVVGRIDSLGVDYEAAKRKKGIVEPDTKKPNTKKPGAKNPDAKPPGAMKPDAKNPGAKPAGAGKKPDDAPSPSEKKAGITVGGSLAVAEEVLALDDVLFSDPPDASSGDEEDGQPRIDYGSIVHRGTVLANIDPTTYEAQVDQAKAALLRSKADLLQAQSKFNQAGRDWQRAQELQKIQITGTSGTASGRSIKAISDSDFDLAKATWEVAEANVKVAQAVVQQAEATLKVAETNYGYTVIKSPVEGVIVARRVNIGQTVVASLNAPSLFLIAKDLKKMQVWASVNEADIGRIHKDMPVRFTVDAFPDQVFRGTVIQIRLNATMTQNVVTYTVVVETDNSDEKLLPYLTASAQFEEDKLTGVLLVPNAALRWKPRPQQMVPEEREKAAAARGKGGGKDRGQGKSPGDAAKPAGDGAANAKEDRGRIWVKEGNYVRHLDVKIGATDGSFTEISGPEVQEGMEVVVGEDAADQTAAEGENPFAPKLFKNKK